MKPAIQKLLILGTTLFATEVADIVSDVPSFQVVGFVENMDPERCRETLIGLPVIWVDDLVDLVGSHYSVCGLGTTQRSRFIKQAGKYGIPFATVVHPSARISSESSVGEGTIISAGVIVASYSHLGRHVLVNRGTLIGHHTEIGDYNSIGPGSNIAGSCRVGEATYIGMSATVLDHITIGSHVVVGAGSVVTKDVPDNVQVVGVPAKIVKENIEGK